MRGNFKSLIISMFFVAGLAVNTPARSLNSEKVKPPDRLAEATSKLVVAANQYKKSVETVIPFYENAVTAATEAFEKRKELFARGLISRQELEAGEQAITKAKAELEQVRGQIADSDHVIAEARAEEEMARRSLANPRAYTSTAAIMRNEGVAGWAITQASKVQSFFASKFGEQLPISAYGQSATHNRLNFDHRNSVDVALHPDSAEGRALISYLRSNGIPFLAFRSAIPGVATGAHIHIGYPSRRKVASGYWLVASG